MAGNIHGGRALITLVGICVFPSQPSEFERTTPKSSPKQLSKNTASGVHREQGMIFSNLYFNQRARKCVSDGFSLVHLCNHQGPEFFVGKGIKPGIARSL